jgi:hypothetical protein
MSTIVGPSAEYNDANLTKEDTFVKSGGNLLSKLVETYRQAVRVLPSKDHYKLAKSI